MNLPYDKTNPISIEKYAQKLQGKKFREVLEGYHSNKVAKETTITYSEDFSLKEKIFSIKNDFNNALSSVESQRQYDGDFIEYLISKTY